MESPSIRFYGGGGGDDEGVCEARRRNSPMRLG